MAPTPPEGPQDLRSGDSVLIDGDEHRLVSTDGERRLPSLRLILTILLSCLFLIVIAAFVLVDNQRRAADEEARDNEQRCMTMWAEEFTVVTRARTEVSARVREAQQRKDAADNAITDVFVAAFLNNPPPSDGELEKRFERALREYVEARDHLAEVVADADKTSRENPFPVLNLSCMGDQ
jgi:hypothetical protein